MSNLEFLREHFFSGVPRFQYLDTLGRGGMGVVFKARDLDLDEDVAIKVLFAPAEEDEQAILARFKRELQLNRKIKHPNVARLHDFGTSNHHPYVTMEYIEGNDLGRVLLRGPMPPGRAVSILRQVALGTSAAHELGIVHRDIKPQNIMLTPEDGVAILDFGLARGMAPSGLTLRGTTVGTPHYMSPEQARGKPTDGRSDIYAIGVVAFEVLTGDVPFDADSPMAIVAQHADATLPMHLLTKRGTPESLVRIVVRCMAKSPEERFQTASELESALALSGSSLETLHGGRHGLKTPAPPPRVPVLSPAPPPDVRPPATVAPTAPSMPAGPPLPPVPPLAPAPSSAPPQVPAAHRRELPSDLEFDVGSVASRRTPSPGDPLLRARSVASAGAARAGLPRTPPVHKARKPVVLVVEEQPAARKSVASALAAAGCGTLEAVTGQRALEILHDQGVDLLVMQMQMPVLDGFDVARILKSQPRFAELPIVFTASQLPRARLAYALQAGAADVLELPVEPKTVQEKVWRILSHWGFEPPAGMALTR